MKKRSGHSYGWISDESIADCDSIYGREEGTYMRDYVIDPEGG